MKRILALLLSLSLVLSMIVFPASAEDKFTVEAEKVTGTAGGTVSLNIKVTNNPGFSALGLRIYYKSDILTCTAISGSKDANGGFSEWKKFTQTLDEDTQPSNATGKANDTSNLSEERKADGWALASIGYMVASAAFTGDGIIGSMSFTIKGDLESCDTPIEVTVVKTAGADGNTEIKDFATVDGNISILGKAPMLGKVTLTDADNAIVLDTSNSELKFGTLEVNGTTDYTYQAHAWSTSGKEITGNVTWKFKVGSELCTEFRGATIDETTGQIFIPKDASTDVSGTTFAMSVVAQAKEGVTAEKDIETSLIQVRREEYRIAAIQISRKDGETGALIIPATGEAAATAEFVATCTNQYDKPYTGNQTIYWNYGRKDTSKSVTGIRMNGAVLSVSSDAKSVENGSVVLVVTATAGSGEKKVTSNGVEITVQRDAVQRPAKIVISGGPANSTLAVPKTGEQAATATYTATVYDQYGDVIADPGTIKWYLEADDESQPFGTGNESQFIVMKEFAQTFAEGSTSRDVTVKATCNGVSGTKTLTLTREPATVTSLALDGDAKIAVPKSGEAEVTRSYLNAYDQYGVEMNSSNLAIEWKKDANVKGVNFVNGGIKVTSAAAENKFTEENGKLQFTFDISASIHGNNPVTKTIILTRDPAEAKTMIWGTDDRPVEVPANDSGKADANVTVTVRDQYGQKMTDAKVELDGAQEGFVWEGGKLYVTKAAKTHFGGERQDKVTVYVRLKSGNATATAKVTLKLEDAYTNRQSAEITGQANITKPTDNTPNTAVYSILNNEMKDQYGLPITFEPSKLTMTLEDKEDEFGFSVKNGPVTLSGPVDGKWTITVTSGAVVNTKYYLKAKYSDMQCAPVKEITITDKAVSETPLPVVQGDITYGETVSPSVSNKPAGAGAITYTYAGRDGTTYNSSDAPINAGEYTVTATCEDANYIYTGSVDFQILPKEIKVDWIELTNDEYTYNGREQTVQYTVKDGNTTLVKDRDYTVEGDKQTNAGVHLLKIIGTGNYTSNFTAAAGAPSVTWNIWEATLTVTGADIPAINYDSDFDGALNVNSVTFSGLMNGETLAKGTDYTVAATVGNRNAGTHQVVLTVRLLNGNYKFEQGSGIVIKDNANITVTINKIDHQAEAVSVGCKYGSTVRVPLAEYLPDGWSVQQSAISVDSNGNGNVHKSFRLEDTTLVVELNNSEALVGKYVKITLPVASTNYNPFTITVTVTVQNKKTQTVTASDLNVTYGDAGVKLNASALDNAKLTYQVTVGADVVTVDTNGNVTLRKSGTAKIQITAAETEDYGTANTTVTVTVAKRSLTVKADDLTAYVGGQLPALDYTVTGLVSGDTLTTVPELELKDVPAGVDPMKTAGTYTIGFKTAPVADKDKYDLTVETGTLTVSSRPNVNPVPAGNSVKLEEAAGGKLTSSVSRATKGTTVTITVKPDAGYQLEELEVLDKNGEALPLKELANGKFSFQMPDSKVTVQASFVQESTYAGYPDVLPQDWFYSSVRYVTERGLMNGTPNGFEPNMDSSRATIWTILARFSGVDTTVVSGEWYAVARQWAMENGVSDGTNPNGVITREQLATMLYRFAKNKGLVQEPVTADLSVFVDAGQISDYALDAMRWAVSVGLLNGMDGSRLAPQGSAARAQVAAMLMRFDQLAK